MIARRNNPGLRLQRSTLPALPALLALLALLAGLAAAGQAAEPRAAGPEFGEFTPDVEWVSPLGWGGASMATAGAESNDRPLLTHFKGLHLDFDRQEIIFFGERRRGYSSLSSRQLLDCLALALRASAGRAPGVSIDPRPQQLGGLQNNNPMDVVYFGGVEQTDVGYAAWRADVLMKFLSFGCDNGVDGPAGSARFFRAMQGVGNHQTELHLLQHFGVSPGWQRFWIQQRESSVASSQDRRTWTGSAVLEIDTEKMAVKDGRLVSAPDREAPSSEAFAKQLTERYDDYARQFPAFQDLRNYAAVINIAAALNREAAKDSFAKQLWRLLRGHQVTPRETPEITRAMVQNVAAGRIRLQLTGGVNLNPQESPDGAPKVDSDVDQLGERIATARRDEIWSIRGGGPPQFANAAVVRRPTAVRQEDFRQGPIRVLREYTPGAGNAAPDWSLLLPEIKFSEQRRNGLPKSAIVSLGAERILLGTKGAVKIPGQPDAKAYFSKGRRTTLAVFSNRLLILRGQVGWVGGRAKPQDGGRVIEFDVLETDGGVPVESRVVRETSQRGTVRYRYQGERLVGIAGADATQASATFAYEDGRLQGIYGAGGRSVEYFYDDQQRLRYLADQQSRTLSYIYEGDNLVGVYSPGAIARRKPSRGSAWFVDGAPVARSELRPEGPLNPDFLTVQIEPDTSSGRAGFVLKVNGKPLLPGKRINSVGPRLDAADTIAALLQHPLVRQSRGVLLTGQRDVAVKLAPMLRRQANMLVYCAGDPQAASAKMDAEVSAAIQPHWLFFDDTLDGSVANKLRPILQEMKVAGLPVDRLRDEHIDAWECQGDTVTLCGHNGPAFQQRLRALAQSGKLRDKDLVLLTCGSPGLLQLVNELLRDFGVRSVTGFSQPIQQQQLPSTVDALQAAAKEVVDDGSTVKRRHRSSQAWISRGLKLRTRVGEPAGSSTKAETDDMPPRQPAEPPTQATPGRPSESREENLMYEKFSRLRKSMRNWNT